MIEVILLERIERLGPMGTVVKVKPGYARNYLLPQKKALRATKANLDLFEKQRAGLEAKNAAMKEQAEKMSQKIDGMKLVVIRQASETGQLYGSVSARDVTEAAKDAGQTIERAMVQIDAPIKALGLYPVKIRLHADVTAKVTINVARSPEEATVQAEKDAALIKAAEKHAEAAAEKASIEAIGETPEEPKAKSKGKKAKAAKEGDEAEGKKAKSEKAEDAEETKKAKKPRARKSETKED